MKILFWLAVFAFFASFVPEYGFWKVAGCLVLVCAIIYLAAHCYSLTPGKVKEYNKD